MFEMEYQSLINYMFHKYGDEGKKIAQEIKNKQIHEYISNMSYEDFIKFRNIVSKNIDYIDQLLNYVKKGIIVPLERFDYDYFYYEIYLVISNMYYYCSEKLLLESTLKKYDDMVRCLKNAFLKEGVLYTYANFKKYIDSLNCFEEEITEEKRLFELKMVFEKWCKKINRELDLGITSNISITANELNVVLNSITKGSMFEWNNNIKNANAALIFINMIDKNMNYFIFLLDTIIESVKNIQKEMKKSGSSKENMKDVYSDLYKILNSDELKIPSSIKEKINRLLPYDLKDLEMLSGMKTKLNIFFSKTTLVRKLKELEIEIEKCFKAEKINKIKIFDGTLANKINEGIKIDEDEVEKIYINEKVCEIISSLSFYSDDIGEKLKQANCGIYLSELMDNFDGSYSVEEYIKMFKSVGSAKITMYFEVETLLESSKNVSEKDVLDIVYDNVGVRLLKK